MCCVVEANVDLSNTVIYAAEVQHPTQGLVHVIGYQNNLEARSFGPNAMILPIPAESVGQENVIDATAFKDILRDYRASVEAMKPKFRSEYLGMMKGGDFLQNSSDDDLQVFESGSYTVVLAQSAASLQKGLSQVPVNKRPNIPETFLTSLAQLYPRWPIAICCFEMKRSAVAAEPVFFWYKPQAGYEGALFAPGIDAHDGNPPNLKRQVWRDHTLIFGSVKAEGIRKAPGLSFDSVPEENRWMFTDAVLGTFMQDRNTKNGDFVMPLSKVMDKTVPGYIGADQVKVEVPGLSF